MSASLDKAMAMMLYETTFTAFSDICVKRKSGQIPLENQVHHKHRRRPPLPPPPNGRNKIMLAKEHDQDRTHLQQQDPPCRQLIGQIVHARKCYKRLFFLDVRVSEHHKCTVLFRSDDSRDQLSQWLSDAEVAALWRRVRHGDTITIQVFDPSEEEIAKRDHLVYQATDFNHQAATPPSRSELDNLKDDVELVSKSVSSVSWEDYCKFWISSHKCLKKDCRKRHPTGEEYVSVQAMWVKERIQARQERSRISDDPHAMSSKVPHSQRALIFSQWLVKVFGKDYLNSGSGVLDVAGGKGEISLFLTHMFGIRSTVVEPNVRRDTPYQRRHLMDVIQKQQKLEAGGDKEVPMSSTCTDHGGGQVSRTIPEDAHDGGVYESASNSNGCEVVESDQVQDEQEAAKKERRRLKKLQRDQFIVPRLCTLLDDEFEQNHSDILDGASILIGMHPDQATEPIVDMALKHNKPFAVVPCCVFGHENPHRRLSNGGAVDTTLEFIQYLIEKDMISGVSERVRKEFLPFVGMNIVVFRPRLQPRLG
ncbi:hypothetical protein BGZ65_009917 [Modicella reniformis]|uniref:C3H1-type domain-containing protein n=1 Tax=Modicella reniformis TaxID=1440133 RepID=A0A9P6MDU6_9FUNG|nr:hypothetical protein BGZ65_009917 [Modicella reniformis]